LDRARGLLVLLIIIVAVVLTTRPWFGTAPQLRRVPLQLAVMIVACCSMRLAEKFKDRFPAANL
jgi:hypothetical protein